jgi:hypothetical protein
MGTERVQTGEIQRQLALLMEYMVIGITKMRLTKRVSALLCITTVACVAAAFIYAHHLAFKRDAEKIAKNDPFLWTNPFSKSSPAYSEFNEYRQWALNNTKLTTAGDVKRPADRFTLAGHLAAEGYARLPTELLEQQLPLVGKMLESLDTHMCSRFIKQGIPDSEFIEYALPVMNAFSDIEAKTWFQGNKSAIEAQLDGSPVIVLSDSDAKLAILKLSKAMYKPQASVFMAALANLSKATDEDACSAARTLYLLGNTLPEPYRGHLARILMTGDNGKQVP